MTDENLSPTGWPDLLVPPHLVPQFLEMLVGNWLPDTTQQEQMLLHLADCSFCRVALIVLLSTAAEADRRTSLSDAAALAVLQRWVAIQRRLEETGMERKAGRRQEDRR